MKYVPNFRRINFVRPLYRRVYNKVLPKKNLSNVTKIVKLDGRGVSVKYDRSIAAKKCRKLTFVSDREIKRVTNGGGERKNVGSVEPVRYRPNMFGLVNMDASNGENRRGNLNPDSWLRVYPAPILPGESVWSIIFRCVLCQLGLAFILVVWTMGWMVIINHFEGPYEKKVSMEFQNRQHQLVIDLATQLRQMTPVSPKWRNIIKDRIEEERQLTIQAVGNGARLRPGRFWDMSGTFLFTVYVMTALGFGAPVPQTIGGRASTLVYAILAVPTQIYLMVNASKCIVMHVEDCIRRLLRSLNETGVFKFVEENREYRDAVEPNKWQRNCSIMVGFLCIGRCMPLTILLYYMFGVFIFGVARQKAISEMVMFPLEFTTTGGLEKVEAHVRVLYGLYVEGAMMLVACALDAVRRHSGSTVSVMTQKYRLFDFEPSESERESVTRNSYASGIQRRDTKGPTGRSGADHHSSVDDRIQKRDTKASTGHSSVDNRSVDDR